MAWDIEGLSIAGANSLIQSGSLSSVELTTQFLERISRLNPELNLYLTVDGEGALACAERAEKEIRAGRYRGRLHGIPFSIKDNLLTKGLRTTAGSGILADWVPSYDATVIAKLRAAGAIILGKTNMDEWALGGATVNAHYGPAHNPWDPSRITGGSSGGSAAAVASSMCLASIGTDSAQSVRNPAAICGVAGLKATYGRVSRFGGVPGTGGFSTDHFGVLTKTVEDCAIVLQAIAGYDPQDPTSANEPVPDYSLGLGADIRDLKAGIIKGYFDDILIGEVKDIFAAALKTLQSIGLKIEEVEVPYMDLIPAVKNCTSRVENAVAHEHYLRTRPRDYSPGVLYAYATALLTPATTYVTAQRVRRVICRQFDEALDRVQVLVVPTIAHPTPTIEESQRGSMSIDGREIKLQDSRGSLNSLCTIPFNITGLPALSVCCGFTSSGMPVGLQIASRAFQEETVLQVAHAYEQASQWYAKRPRLT